MNHRSGSRRARPRPLGRARTVPLYLAEPVERRLLLSAINWTNRGTGPSNDTDNFNAIFGPNAAQARLIVDRAIADWRAVIVNFNHSGGGNTFTLSIQAGSLPPNVRGQSNFTDQDADGVPTAGTLTLDNDAGEDGWYFDPQIGDDAEFATVRAPFSAEGTMAGNDLRLKSSDDEWPSSVTRCTSPSTAACFSEVIVMPLAGQLPRMMAYRASRFTVKWMRGVFPSRPPPSANLIQLCVP